MELFPYRRVYRKRDTFSGPAFVDHDTLKLSSTLQNKVTPSPGLRETVLYILMNRHSYFMKRAQLFVYPYLAVQ